MLKISGIGARMALAVLSGMSVTELAQAITLQEAGRLTKVPGIANIKSSFALKQVAYRTELPLD